MGGGGEKLSPAPPPLTRARACSDQTNCGIAHILGILGLKFTFININLLCCIPYSLVEIREDPSVLTYKVLWMITEWPFYFSFFVFSKIVESVIT